MKCEMCNKETPLNDFINHNNVCYKCVYKSKKLIETNRDYCCKECNNKFSISKEIKIRQKTLYCSDDCASIGYKKQRGNYWTKQLKSGPI